MASSRRDASTGPAALRPESTAAAGLLPDRPPIAALFLIEFDVKAGYTIVWKQAVPGLDLSGAVEYKSLPSGLHAVSEDLIYFVHEDSSGDGDNDDNGVSGSSASASNNGGYAGLSAFVNLPTDEAGARFARMIAVGVLVPRSYGRLGRAWRHAEALMDMARKLAANSTELPILEAYWRENSSLPTAASPADEVDRPLLQITDSPLGSPAVTVLPVGYRPPFGGRAQHSRNRSASDGTALLLPPGHRLSPHHPAWSLTSLLETFGPLIFPIYRAALLRKRILISTHAPVREVNNFVYNISVLANIPISALDVLEPSVVSRQRIRPLFTIGVNDIAFLLDDYAASKRAARQASRGDSSGTEEAAYSGPGWIACTTDSILAMKGELWDVLITMPPVRVARAGEKKIWPTVEVAKGVPLKATQRDLRRFEALTTGLERLIGRTFGNGGSTEASAATAASGRSTADASGVAAASSLSNRHGLFSQDDAQLVDAAEAVVEPVTWAALAYNGFMWWASAGEQRRSDETDETIHDAQLLADIVPPKPGTPSAYTQHHAQTQAAASAASPTQSAALSNIRDSVTSLTARRAPAEDGEDQEEEEEERARIELAIITYFHRLTTQILSVLADIVESSEDDGDYYEDDEGEDGYYYDDDDDEISDAGGIAANGASADRGGDDLAASGRPGRVDDDGLVGARRSGLASSTTALLLRRRGGGEGRHRGAGGSSSRRPGVRGAPGGGGSSSSNSSSSSPIGIASGDRRHTGVGTSTSTGTSCGGSSSSSSLRVSSDAVTRMGLDVWSQADAGFVRDVAQQYFGRRGVHVEGKGVEVCGLKVC